jgi:hypothetical protein
VEAKATAKSRAARRAAAKRAAAAALKNGAATQAVAAAVAEMLPPPPTARKTTRNRSGPSSRTRLRSGKRRWRASPASHILSTVHTSLMISKSTGKSLLKFVDGGNKIRVINVNSFTHLFLKKDFLQLFF